MSENSSTLNPTPRPGCFGCSRCRRFVFRRSNHRRRGRQRRQRDPSVLLPVPEEKLARSAQAHRTRPSGPSGNRRGCTRKACGSRRCRNSRAIGRPITTGARCEAKLNALPQFITEIDGLDIHFIHVRSKHENALPLIVTHGWPGSIIEQLKIIDPLTESDGTRRQRIGRVPCRDSVDAGLRLLGQADRDRLGPRAHGPGLGGTDEAPRLHPLCRPGRRLGRVCRRPDGLAGAGGIARHPHQHACHRSG